MPPRSEFPYLTGNVKLFAKAWQSLPLEIVAMRQVEIDAILRPASVAALGLELRRKAFVPEGLVHSPLAEAFVRELPHDGNHFSDTARLGKAFAGMLRVGPRNGHAAAAEWVTYKPREEGLVDVALHPQYRPSVLAAATASAVTSPAILETLDHSPPEAQDAWIALWLSPPRDPFTALDRAARLLRLRFAPLN